MKIRFSLGATLICLWAMPACDDSAKTYPVRFVCESPGDTACPAGSECPALPLGADTCGELPGLFGHPATPVTKGRPVAIDGRLEWREWETQDGAKRQAIDIIADSVQFLGSRDDASGGGGFAGNGASKGSDTPMDEGDFAPAPVSGSSGDDDIPF